MGTSQARIKRRLEKKERRKKREVQRRANQNRRQQSMVEDQQEETAEQAGPKCSDCPFFTPEPMELNQGICCGAPPCVFPMGNGRMGTMAPRVQKNALACGQYFIAMAINTLVAGLQRHAEDRPGEIIADV